MRQKKYIVTLLVLLALVVSGFTYAYWSEGVSVNTIVDSTSDIQIGTGSSVTTTASVTSATSLGSDTLVPVGHTGSGKVSSVTITFTVTWVADADNAPANGTTATLGSSALLAGFKNGGGAVADPELALFTVSAPIFSATTLTYNATTAATATVKYTVTFTSEPADQAQYALIAQATLVLTASFTLVPTA